MAKLRNKSSEEETGEYITSDLGCAAALDTAGFELLALDRSNPRKVQFVFRRVAGIQEVIDGYWSNRLEQKSRAYWESIKNLKNRLYSDN